MLIAFGAEQAADASPTGSSARTALVVMVGSQSLLATYRAVAPSTSTFLVAKQSVIHSASQSVDALHHSVVVSLFPLPAYLDVAGITPRAGKLGYALLMVRVIACVNADLGEKASH